MDCFICEGTQADFKPGGIAHLCKMHMALVEDRDAETLSKLRHGPHPTGPYPTGTRPLTASEIHWLRDLYNRAERAGRGFFGKPLHEIRDEQAGQGIYGRGPADVYAEDLRRFNKESTVSMQDLPQNPTRIEDAPDDPWHDRHLGMRCRTCRFYVRKTPRSDNPVLSQELGRCRRHAPSMSGFPAVYPTDWCGDHKLDENKT